MGGLGASFWGRIKEGGVVGIWPGLILGGLVTDPGGFLFSSKVDPHCKPLWSREGDRKRNLLVNTTVLLYLGGREGRVALLTYLRSYRHTLT